MYYELLSLSTSQPLALQDVAIDDSDDILNLVAGVSTVGILAEPFGFLHLFGCLAGISLVFGFS